MKLTKNQKATLKSLIDKADYIELTIALSCVGEPENIVDGELNEFVLHFKDGENILELAHNTNYEL